MSKRFFGKALIALAFLVVALFWLFYFILPEQFGWFNFSWGVVIVLGTIGVVSILTGIFGKTPSPLKKFYIFIGAGFALIAGLIIINATSTNENIVWPIVAIVVAAAVVISLFATKGKKWDHGDNQSIGYKNYHERKKEEEKNKDN